MYPAAVQRYRQPSLIWSRRGPGVELAIRPGLESARTGDPDGLGMYLTPICYELGPEVDVAKYR